MKEAVSQAAALPRLRGQVRTFGERPNTNKKGDSPDCECLEHGGSCKAAEPCVASFIPVCVSENMKGKYECQATMKL